MIYRGRCWKFGDNVGIDTHIMPLNYTLQRLSDPQVLKDHVFEEVDPEFHRNARPGDVIVAGRRFGHGNPHLQAFLGIRGLGMGVVADSMPRGAFRIAVYSGVPLLAFCKNVSECVDHGDELQVDFERGIVKNTTKDTTMKYEAPPAEIFEIIRAGGTIPYLRRTIAKGTQFVKC